MSIIGITDIGAPIDGIIITIIQYITEDIHIIDGMEQIDTLIDNGETTMEVEAIAITVVVVITEVMAAEAMEAEAMAVEVMVAEVVVIVKNMK